MKTNNNPAVSINRVRESTYALLVRSEEKERNVFEALVYGLLILSAVAAIFLAGCTNVPRQTTETEPRPDPGKRTYTAEEMRKTGRLTVGGQLEEVDPAVTIRH